MDRVVLFLLCFSLAGCAPWFSGGGSYHYKRFDPTTNATIELAVESTREVGSVTIHFCPDGNVTVEVVGVSPGPNNTAQAMNIIGAVTSLAARAALVP